jgi:NAD(P)H-dependent flavin oxidoreductase YrpB (nitropropane dioxygenase family)
MKLPTLKIGELTAAVPIIQGGMGVGVSLSGLAGAVAAEGGIGVISGAQIGYREPDFEINNMEANLRALKAEIYKAREKCKNGILAVNLMVAMNHYKDSVAAAVEAGIDLIISGAGLPTELPSLIKGFKTKIAPIVSSGKAAAVIAKLWDKKHSYAPDLVVVEGPEAGGHLGFSLEQLTSEEKPRLIDIVKDVIEALKPYEEKYNKQIPVIAAGGIFTGKDIAEYINAGAAGVQMATRFVATEECDASLEYKMAYINSEEKDIRLVKSPVGMPGRAISNEFLGRLEEGNIPVRKCYDCLKPCNPGNTPYCISKALIEAVKGNLKDGLIFTGSNAYRIDKIVKVKELMKQLVEESEKYLM